jgi:hypothetical protein
MHKAVFVWLATPLFLAGCASEPPKAPAAPNPAIACGETIQRNPDFAPIRGKVFLGNAQNQPADLMNIPDKATDAEKSVIAAWLAARQNCFHQSQAWLQQGGMAKEYLSLLGDINSASVARTEDLMAGRLTYGDYARARRDLVERVKIESERMDRYLRSQ